MNHEPSFWTATKYGFKHWKDAKGRARRSEFWYFTLAIYIIALIFSSAMMPISSAMMPICWAKMNALLTSGSTITMNDTIDFMKWMLLYIFLPMLILEIPLLFAMIRRLHDIGKSGWNFFCGLIPAIGPILVFIWLVTDSDPKENRYGPSPKYDPNLADFYKS